MHLRSNNGKRLLAFLLSVRTFGSEVMGRKSFAVGSHQYRLSGSKMVLDRLRHSLFIKMWVLYHRISPLSSIFYNFFHPLPAFPLS